MPFDIGYAPELLPPIKRYSLARREDVSFSGPVNYSSFVIGFATERKTIAAENTLLVPHSIVSPLARSLSATLAAQHYSKAAILSRMPKK
ncbi:TPA: hypothetical protein HA251_06415 [Candidatus Woesearchaeota archaeon]|nr:hypothetical protein [Candidatus Woesearchaeota archaeon]